ncbi:10133_t:CDS:1 [Funneliformis caledonium]|uniref:10133_t:CDS:1 n=1 Tax=Funneliformis caledonium TaxID=1117310 RepID=A0A9N9IC40_9GLOM|nr:10133_t:CDS:1 [Funneliformis caledonium]
MESPGIRIFSYFIFHLSVNNNTIKLTSAHKHFDTKAIRNFFGGHICQISVL